MLALASLSGIVEQAITGFVQNVTNALPNVITGLVFLVAAAVLIRAIRTIAGLVLRRVFHSQPLYAKLANTVIGIFVWFGAFLTFLTAVGLGEIAAALGTASGFLALGVSYALSDMIEDTVAGIYLLRDPDFAVGDRVVAGDITGTVKSIELRKTRFTVEDKTVVRANADVEKKWTKLPAEASESDGDVTE